MSLRTSPLHAGINAWVRRHARLGAATLGLLLAATAGGAALVKPAAIGTIPAQPDFVHTGLPSAPLRTYVTDGVVHAIQRVGDTIYVGGSFSRVGTRSGYGAEVALNGTQNAGLPEITGTGPTINDANPGVRVIISDGAGGWYVGGSFSHVGGLSRPNLVHILADHSVDPDFFPQMNGMVSALALHGSTLYIGGTFNAINGTVVGNYAAYHVLYNYVMNSPAADGSVNALALSSDGLTVYAGGTFSTFSGQPRAGLAALTGSTGQVATGFSVLLGGSSAPRVSALAVSGTALYLSGSFDTVNGVALRALAAVTIGGASDGTVIPGFVPGPSAYGSPAYCTVDSLAVSAGLIYAIGSFDTIGGQSRKYIAALNPADGSANGFDPSPTQGLNTLAVSGSTVYVTGGFSSIGGASRNNFAALNAADGSASAFDPDPNGTVSSVAVSSTAVYFGGAFTSMGGVARNGLAAFNAADGTPTAWNPDAVGDGGGNATIYALQAVGPVVYVGGAFATLGGQAHANVGAVDAITGTATSWNAVTDGQVDALAVTTDTVYIGGEFGTLDSQALPFLGAVTVANGSVTTWSPAPDSSVRTLALTADRLYVGGFFPNIAGAARNSLAAFKLADGSLDAWDPNLSSGNFGTLVYALAVSGTTIYVGGDFSAVQGVPRRNIAAISMSNGSAGALDAELSSSLSNNDATVYSVATDGTTLYVGGSFDGAGGQPRNHIAAVTANDGRANDFDPNPGAGSNVYALSLNSNRLDVGGQMSSYDFGAQQGFASFANDGIFATGFEDL